MAERTSFRDFACSTARALEIVGDWWTLLIVRDAFFGVRRFEDFRRRLGVSRSVLTNRLNGLVDGGVLETRQYESRPPRVEYVLTRKGRDLYPVLVALQQWGDRWESPKPPVVLHHRACGKRTTPRLVCSACGERIDAKDVDVRPGPGGTDPDMLPPVGSTGASDG